MLLWIPESSSLELSSCWLVSEASVFILLMRVNCVLDTSRLVDKYICMHVIPTAVMTGIFNTYGAK